MNRIKVLHVHTLPIVSGSGINTYLTMKRTPRDRFEVSLACAPGGMLNYIVRGNGMAVHEVRNMVQPLHPVKDLRALFELVRILRREEITVVHTHNSKAGFLGRLAGKIAKTPVVIHTVHGFSFHDNEPWIRRVLFKRLERRAARWADRMIYISQPMIDWAEREGILQEGAYSKIYSGIDLEAFRKYDRAEQGRLRNELGLGMTDPVIGFVSKLWEGKGHTVALKAITGVLKKHPDVKLLLVGEGDLEPSLRERVREYGIEASVIFAGFRTKIAEITALCDFCILPSFYEGMGRVLLEAGASGKAVVATTVGGIPDVVVDGKTGILIPPGEPSLLAEAMLRLLNDPGLRLRMGENARRRIGEKFDAGTMVDEIVAVYDLCLKQKGIAVPELSLKRCDFEKVIANRKTG
ncbi:MAG: glycosyltransferase family 4 protein [Deltaproteobacteria bacterium]|nr:glycosyltransferase family 4 protein [Deltaproteobacteria bacterium]